VFRRILLWFAGILLVSFVGFLITNRWLTPRAQMHGNMMQRVIQFEFQEAINAYESGGAPALRAFLTRLNALMPPRHHLLDAQGKDLATGADRSDLLRAEETRGRFPIPPSRRMLIRRTSPGGGYVYVAEGEPPRPDPWTEQAVYLWIVVAVVLLCWALAHTLARPVRQLRETVLRFGHGDHSSRARMDRKDEIGDLARAFDEMADRTETLLTAERRLLQDVSHELRSPLARLRFAVELARSNGEASSAAMGRIKREVERLSTLVGELLQVTRAEGDPASRNFTEVDLANFLRELVDDCSIEAHARSCTVDLHVRDNAVWSGDRELLHRAVENVVRNAIAHAPDGTEIEVDLVPEPGRIVIRVRDYGPGIPEEHLERVFQPFFRVEEDRSRNNGGVGLGLAIAQRAVRAHNGEIHAANADPGLLVEMRLPR
jgi:two-component system sensor histidine kinase CpxA